MDVVELHRRASEEFVRRVTAIHPDQWDGPTPCTDWDVRALVNHVVAEERWTVPLMTGQTIEDVGSTLDGDLLGDNPADAATQAAHAAQLAVTEPVLTGATVQLSYGPERASEYAYQLATDHLVHSWDLAVAIGQDPRMDPELVADVADWFKDKEELYRAGGAIADRVGTSLTDPQDELIGAFGRNPHWTQAHAAVARGRLTPADLDEIRFLITTKKGLHAVKLIRERTGLDLKPSKDLYDEIRYGRFVPPVTDTPVVRRPGNNLAERTRALKAAGDLHQATALVVSETGMTEAEAGLFVGALQI